MIPLRDNIPSRGFPFVNWVFIAANLYVFVLELKIHDPVHLQLFINTWAVVPERLWSHLATNWVTLITAMFLHGGWMHVLFNLLFLYIFGDNVEDTMGHFKYLVFYLMVGVVANGAQAYLSATSAIPLLGASGAIAGVLGAYFFYYPHARVVTLIPLFIFITIREIPAFFFLLYWFVLQALNSTLMISAQLVTKQSVGGVAWAAHAAGFLAGLLAAPAFGRAKSRFR